MKLIQHIYRYLDARGRYWKVYSETLPKKKRGEYKYWIGETEDGKVTTKGNSKSDVLFTILKLENFK